MAAQALAKLGDGRAQVALLEALKDAIPDVRFWAAHALAILGDARALPELRQLADRDEAVLPEWGSVPAEAAGAIQTIQRRLAEQDAQALLMTSVGSYQNLADNALDPSIPASTRAVACRALGLMRDKRALPALRHVLEHQHEPPEVRAAAAEALGRLGP